MKLLFWIVGIPLLLLAAFFAIANRELVTVSLWPVAEPVDIPLFVAIVAPLYVGVIIGALAGWWSGAWRGRAGRRAETRRAATLEREVATLKSQLKTAESRRTEAVMTPATDRVLSAPPSFMP